MIAESKISTVHDEFDIVFSDEFKRAFKNAREFVIENEINGLTEEDKVKIDNAFKTIVG